MWLNCCSPSLHVWQICLLAVKMFDWTPLQSALNYFWTPLHSALQAACYGQPHHVCVQAPSQSYSFSSRSTKELRRSKAEEKLASISEGNNCSIMVMSNVRMFRNSALAGGAVYTTSPQGFYTFCPDLGAMPHSA